MMDILFKGKPFLFIGDDDSLDHSGAIAKAEDYKAGRCSFAHYWPTADGIGVVRRFNRSIGTKADIEVVGIHAPINMTLDDLTEAFATMLTDDSWLPPSKRPS